MAEGFKANTSGSVANQILNHAFRGTTFVAPTAWFVQLHTAAPGANGTVAVANSNRRVQCTFTVGANGQVSNVADIDFVAVASTQTYTFATIWDTANAGPSAGGGVFLMSGSLTGSASVGNTFTISAGQLVLTLNAAT